MGRSCSGPLWMLPSNGSSNYEKKVRNTGVRGSIPW
jgi:hypothetical protein